MSKVESYSERHHHLPLALGAYIYTYVHMLYRKTETHKKQSPWVLKAY